MDANLGILLGIIAECCSGSASPHPSGEQKIDPSGDSTTESASNDHPQNHKSSHQVTRITLYGCSSLNSWDLQLEPTENPVSARALIGLACLTCLERICHGFNKPQMGDLMGY